MAEIVIDINALTLGDLEEGVRIAGPSFAEALEGKVTPGPSALVALIFLSRRKTEPEITLDEVRAMPLAEVAKVRLAGESLDPTE